MYIMNNQFMQRTPSILFSFPIIFVRRSEIVHPVKDQMNVECSHFEFQDAMSCVPCLSSGGVR